MKKVSSMVLAGILCLGMFPAYALAAELPELPVTPEAQVQVNTSTDLPAGETTPAPLPTPAPTDDSTPVPAVDSNIIAAPQQGAEQSPDATDATLAQRALIAAGTQTDETVAEQFNAAVASLSQPDLAIESADSIVQTVTQSNSNTGNIITTLDEGDPQDPPAEPTIHNINYYLNDGSEDDLFASDPAPDDEVYTIRDESASPIREGWWFLGWANSRDGIELDPSYSFTPDADRSFYAVWWQDRGEILDIYWRVEYDANGGTGAIPVDTEQYYSDFKVVVKTSPVPTRKGYTFDGWSLSPKGKTITSFIITTNTVLYAQWTKVPVPAPIQTPLPIPSAVEQVGNTVYLYYPDTETAFSDPANANTGTGTGTDTGTATGTEDETDGKTTTDITDTETPLTDGIGSGEPSTTSGTDGFPIYIVIIVGAVVVCSFVVYRFQKSKKDRNEDIYR